MKRLILVAMLVAGCGGTEPVVSAAGTWHSTFKEPTGTMTLTVSIAQDDSGVLTGPAILNTDLGIIDGQINGKENAYIVLRFPNDAIVMQMTGLPNRMFGSVYLNGTASVGVEFTRH